MELAGLEPATSWVRFRRPNHSNSAALQDFRVLAQGSIQTRSLTFAGDSRELRPQDHACGLNAGVRGAGRRSTTPAWRRLSGTS
jgi:hypothetical protein